MNKTSFVTLPPDPLLLGTPIFGVTLCYFFLTMTPSLWQILGLVMISSGLVLVYKEKQVVYDQ